MKKRNKNKNICNITRLWPSVEDMKKDLFIDLEKQEITRLSTGNKLTASLSGNKNSKYKVVNVRLNGKDYKLKVHRLFFYWHNGYLPKLIDHKDTNRLNNHIENIRELNSSGNARNSNKRKTRNGKPSSSKYKGVTRRIRNGKVKYEVAVAINYKKVFNGTFYNEDDAGQAYNDKIRQLGLEGVSILNDTPQERARKNNQFDPLPQEMNHIKVLFQDIEPLVDLK